MGAERSGGFCRVRGISIKPEASRAAAGHGGEAAVLCGLHGLQTSGNDRREGDGGGIKIIAAVAQLRDQIILRRGMRRERRLS